MSDVKPSSIQSIDPQPRHPFREVAELLATAICRMHTGHASEPTPQASTVRLDNSCHPSVHANPPQPEGMYP